MDSAVGAGALTIRPLMCPNPHTHLCESSNGRNLNEKGVCSEDRGGPKVQGPAFQTDQTRRAVPRVV